MPHAYWAAFLTAILQELSPWFYNVFIDSFSFLVACHLVAGGGLPAPVPLLLRGWSLCASGSCHDVAGWGLHVDLPDADTGGSFAAWV